MHAVHHHFMQIALLLAMRNLGQTWPNPAVGALVVKNGQIVGQGCTQPGGRPHAETLALAQAGERAKRATLYVTLEPCSHQGETPPCTDAIIKAKIAQVIVACNDPNPRVNGEGIARLRSAGIEVIENVCHGQAREINRGFISVMERKRPYIALKMATSLDGKMTGGKDRWITGERARAYGHMLRSYYDAIATGIGTVLMDDPLLTCRLPGLEDRSPIRIVFDREKRLPKHSKLIQTSQEIPLWQMDAALDKALVQLAEKGITRLLVEAGQGLSTAFLQSKMVDRIYWFRAPTVIGEQGMPAFSSAFSPFIRIDQKYLQPDTLDILECSPAL